MFAHATKFSPRQVSRTLDSSGEPMRVTVRESHKRPYENPMAVLSGEQVFPDSGRSTDIEGWVWCTAEDGRSGWAPRKWITQANGKWSTCRDYNSIELTIVRGEVLEAIFEESGFYWAEKANGEAGWIPCDSAIVTEET